MASRALSSAEAAARLGIKPSSLYVYVSRGLVHSHPAPSGRRRLYDAAEIDGLARRAMPRAEGQAIASITTAVAEVRRGGARYRGRSAVDLARGSTFERVAELLWASGDGSWTPLPLELPRGLSRRDQLRAAVPIVGAHDAFRSDLRRESVVSAARTLIATISASLSETVPGRGRPIGSVASMLAGRLSPLAPRDTTTQAIDSALILFAAGDLALSALAVRIAASARADLYDAMLSGLGIAGGDGLNASSAVYYALLRSAEEQRIEDELVGFLRTGRARPSGSPSERDVYFSLFRGSLEGIATPRKRRAFERLLLEAEHRNVALENPHFGLVSLMWAIEAPVDAAETLYSIAQMSGWIAHYLEELQEEPLRLRPRVTFAASDMAAV